MGQSSNDAASKDALVRLDKEECVRGMGQRSSTKESYAAVKVAQIF